jgi:tRNA(adenine34) deaminase
MRLALSQALLALEKGDVPVGCVIVHGETLVGQGFNEREIDHDPTAHAEILALRRASARLKRWRLSDCTAYITLEPCFMCAGALVHARVGRVVYAATDPKTGAAESLAQVLQDSRLNHQCEVTKGILAEESSMMLKNFFRVKRSSQKKKTEF